MVLQYWELRSPWRKMIFGERILNVLVCQPRSMIRGSVLLEGTDAGLYKRFVIANLKFC